MSDDDLIPVSEWADRLVDVGLAVRLDERHEELAREIADRINDEDWAWVLAAVLQLQGESED